MISSTLQGVLDARGQIGLVALAGVLWSSLGFFQSLVSAINQAWKLEPLNWWKLPLKNLMMVGVLASALLLGNVLPVILKTVQGYMTFSRVLDGGALRSGRCARAAAGAFLRVRVVLQARAAPRGADVTFAMVWLPALLVTASAGGLPAAFRRLHDAHHQFQRGVRRVRRRDRADALDLSVRH